MMIFVLKKHAALSSLNKEKTREKSDSYNKRPSIIQQQQQN